MSIDIPALLRRYGLRPRKGLGQNFLAAASALEKVASAAEITPADAVLEIGPGLGSLTQLLAARAARVVAVEIDGDMLGPLGEVLAGVGNVQIVHGDILEQDLAVLMAAHSAYIAVANIPYYITSAIFRHLLESGHPPERLVLTVQQEVAERICAAPPRMSLLALSVQVYGRPVIAARIPAGAFYPPPKVDSAVVRADVYPEPRIPAGSLDLFFRLAKAGFSQRRKTLRNSISAGMAWTKEEAETALMQAGIDPGRRAETVGLEEWGRLVEVVG